MSMPIIRANANDLSTSPPRKKRTATTKKVVSEVIEMIESNEYKRRQSPPGIKITAKSFGKDRQMPITNRYRPGTSLGKGMKS